MIETEIEVTSYITEKHIAFLSKASRGEALKTLTNLASDKLEDTDAFLQDVIQREEVISTGIGMGIALPHARSNQLEDFFILLGICSEEGIEWDSIDGVSVRLIFLVGGPEDAPKEYLTLLSRLTTCLKDEVFRSKLQGAKNAETVVNIFASC